MSAPRSREAGDEVRLRRVEHATEVPMLILAFAYLPAFVVSYLPGASADVRLAGAVVEYAIVGVFALELLVRLSVAERKLAFLKKNWLDVVIVALPLLRPLRFLRAARALPLIARGLVALRRVMGNYRGAYVLLVGVLSVLSGALVVSVAEQGAGGPIDSFGDALWWSVTTITTVGYGDTHPVTAGGRLVASLLMVIGIALFGLLTASVAAYFVEDRAEDREEVSNRELLRKLEALEARLAEMESRDPNRAGRRDDRRR